MAERFSNTLPLLPVDAPGSVAEKRANASSPLDRASVLVIRLLVLPLVMFTPSAKVLRKRLF